MSTCKNYKNTGVPNCNYLFGNTIRFIFVPLFDNSGAVNEFANVAAVTKSALQAKFDAADIDNRFFPLPIIENLNPTREDSTFYTTERGTKVFIRSGVKNYNGLFLQTHPSLVDAINDGFRGQELGFFAFDEFGNMAYATDTTTLTKVQPIPIDGKSIDATFMDALTGEPNKIMLSFDVDKQFKDGRLRYINADDLDFDGTSLIDVYALIDVSTLVTVTSSATTEITMTLIDNYNDTVKGLLLADFTVYNVTQDKTLTPDSVTETPDGVYVFDLTTEDGAGNVVSTNVVKITPAKSKYNFAEGAGFNVTMA